MIDGRRGRAGKGRSLRQTRKSDLAEARVHWGDARSPRGERVI